MDYRKLADLLFPDVTDTPAEVEARYPARNLPEGAKVTRFAPSPTGFVHLGGLYGATIDERLAHQSGGVVYLRIEDTDAKREVAGATEKLIRIFRQYGVRFDEGATLDADGNVTDSGSYGPYRQSQRAHIYHVFAKKLVEEGKAYPCFTTEEEYEELQATDRKAEIKSKEWTAADNAAAFERQAAMRNFPLEEVAAHLAAGHPWVLRILSDGDQDGNKKVVFTDLIKGKIEMPENSEDFVLLKSDGIPTYHFAHAVDDHLMGTTHVIRGEEWLPSLPLHYLLYRAFGWADTMPEFAHLPLLLKPDGNGKLSKRDGDRLGFPVFPLEWHDPKTGEVSSGYRESGYLPEAVINFLALLGWNPGNDQELMSLDELVKLFDLHRCSKAGAKFDFEKGKWFNHEYILKKSNEEVAGLFMPILKEHGIEAPMDKVVTVVGLMKDRVSFIKDLWETCKFFFVAPTEYDEKTRKKRWKEDSPERMLELADVLEALDDFSLENQEAVVMKWIEDKGYHLGNIMNAFRLTLVGEGKGPHMFDISAVLGKEETLRRIRRAVEVLK